MYIYVYIYIYIIYMYTYIYIYIYIFFVYIYNTHLFILLINIVPERNGNFFKQCFSNFLSCNYILIYLGHLPQFK